MLRLFSISLASGGAPLPPFVCFQPLLYGNDTSHLDVLGAEIDFLQLEGYKRRIVVTPRVPNSRGNMTQRGELSGVLRAKVCFTPRATVYYRHKPN